jgi:glycosyltransferase involved in cell wall biosynthesis
LFQSFLSSSPSTFSATDCATPQIPIISRAGERPLLIAFYAPLKPLDHPTASGDREMAKALKRALEEAGHNVQMPSPLQSFSLTPRADRLVEFEKQAAAEIDRLLEQSAGHPDLWFSYHSYYKAPDLLGPTIARALAIPYYLAEASYAPKRARDDWHPWQQKAEDGFRLAKRHFCFTDQDYMGLERFLGSRSALVRLPPFIDPTHYPQTPPLRDSRRATELVTVAMMRGGVKLDSYRFLGEALGHLLDVDWRMTIVGDGPERATVERAFSALPPERLRWPGSLDPADVRRALVHADLYLWPGFGEAYGVAYLEAQACGLPIVALDCGGIRSVVVDGSTALLVDPPAVAGFAAAVRRLCLDQPLRSQMGERAHVFIHAERTLAQAAQLLNQHLDLSLEHENERQ